PPPSISTDPCAPPASAVEITPKPQVATMNEVNGSGSATPVVTQSNSSANGDPAGGAQARVFLNDKVVPHLLEGMKSIARDKPADPLRVLGEFLIQRSNEIEKGIKKEPE
ncbi:hypothetical protein N7492_000776, partial [Penicillium capsulatum]